MTNGYHHSEVKVADQRYMIVRYGDQVQRVLHVYAEGAAEVIWTKKQDITLGVQIVLAAEKTQH